MNKNNFDTNDQSDIIAQESGVRSQESGVRSQESGVRSQESGVRSQESGVKIRSLAYSEHSETQDKYNGVNNGPSTGDHFTYYQGQCRVITQNNSKKILIWVEQNKTLYSISMVVM